MLFLLLTGCGVDLSAFLPTVRFDRMDVSDIDFEHIDTDFVFAVDNPNPVGAPVDRFSYSLALAGVELLAGDNPEGLELRAADTSEIALPVSLVFESIYDAVTAARGDDFVDFGFKGGIGFDSDAGPIDINFDEAGNFPALRIPKIKLGKLHINQFTGSNLDLGLDIDVDNDHESTLDFQDIGFAMKVAGVNIGSGALSEPLSVEGATSRTVQLPISINVLDAATAAAAILGGGAVNVEVGVDSNVDTPFGVLPLHMDQTGNVTVQNDD